MAAEVMDPSLTVTVSVPNWRRWAAYARTMPRYFFILVYPDRIIDDPRGTVLPRDEAAIEAALMTFWKVAGPGNPDRSSWSGMKRARSSINSPAIESAALKVARPAAPSIGGWRLERV